MKRLRTVLILLFSLVMSLCLFACGGDEEEQNGGAGTISSVKSVSGYSDLTDSDDEAARDAMLNGIKVTVSYKTEDGTEDVQLTYADCDVTGTISVHVVGEYTLTLKPKENNPDNRSRSITIKVNHNWGEKQGNAYTCAYCQARREVTTENVIIHYGAFHDGTQATNVPFDEKQVYTNKTEGTSRIKEFGEVNGRVVPTLTAGQIEKGETITIRGTSRTTAALAKEDSPWGKVNEYWNSASLGVADRYNNEENSAHPGYAYGSSVIVRQEGWVLYNGIGKTDATSTLAGIAGGYYDGTANNAGGWQNYGSHPDESKTASPKFGSSNYVHGVVPTDWNSVENWWVYSTGTGLNSGDYYNADEPVDVEYIWNYREDGVMEITYNYNYTKPSAMKYLKVYIKVPDSAVNFYDTIIHGDYNDLTITESEFITKNTPKEFTFNGLKSDNVQSVYAENMAFEASTLDLKVEYLQKPGVQNDILLTNNQVYAYVGNMTRAELEATTGADELNSLSSEKWVSLASAKLNANTVAYKIHLSKGGQEYVKLLPENLFTVLENKVGDAVGADVTLDAVKALNNDKVGALSFSLASTTDKTNNAVVLTLGEGYAQPLTDDLKGKLANATDAMKYVALRINGVAGTKATFSAAEVTAKMNNTNVPCAVVLSEDGEDAYLVLALTGAGVVDVTGLQPTTVRLDLTALKGFKVTSAVDSKIGALNVGGDVTVTYTLPANTANSSFGLVGSGISGVYSLANFVNNDSGLPRAISDTITLKKVERAEGTDTLKVTFSVGAAKLNDYQPVKVGLALDNTVEVVDYLDWKFEIDTSADNAVDLGGGLYAIVDSANQLKVVMTSKADDLRGAMSETFQININNGNLDNFKKYGLTQIRFSVDESGKLSLVGSSSYVSGAVSYRGTYGDSRDTDKGKILLFTVNVSGVGIGNGQDYYVGAVGDVFNAQEAPKSIIHVFGRAQEGKWIETVEVSETTHDAVAMRTVDGTCYEEGLYAWAISKKGEDTVLFYAGAGASGGEHVDSSNDNVCDLCGGAMAKNNAITDKANWFPAGGIRSDITEGDVFTLTGTYADNIAEGGFGSVLAVMIEEADGKGWDNAGTDETTNGTYHTTQDGYAYWTNFSWSADSRLPYAKDVEGFGDGEGYQRFTSSIITADHPYNTANGYVNAYGTEINETTFNDAKQGGTFRFVVKYQNGVITTTAQLWSKDMTAFHSTPFFEYTTSVTVNPAAGRYTVYLMGKQATTNVVALKDGVMFTRSRLTNSDIKKVESAAVTVGETAHTAPANIQYVSKIVGANAVVALSGKAAKEGSTYYAAFKITFNNPLVESALVAACGNADRTAITGMSAVLSGDRSTMDVYLPIAVGLKEAYIFLDNYKGSTKQADIKIDLTDLSVSDVENTVSGYDALTLAEGTFTITYTNVQNSDTLILNGTSKALSELANDTAMSGYTVKVAIASNTATVTVKKAAQDIEKVVGGLEVRLERAGNLVARDVLDPVTKVNATDLQLVAGTDWYAKVNGTKLYLLANGQTKPTTLPVNVNAGKTTDPTLLGVYELAYTVKKGAVSFVESNVLTKVTKGVYSKGAQELVVLVIDLSSFSVEAATPYGFSIETSNFTKYYTVNAQRAIEEKTNATSEKVSIRATSCAQGGLNGWKEGDTFYYGFDVIAALEHEWTEKTDATKDELHGYDKMYTCDNGCGSVKYEQVGATEVWGDKTGWPGGDTGWKNIGVLYAGGYYEITGTNESNEANVWDFNAPGLSAGTTGVADGLRIDHWCMDQDTELPVVTKTGQPGDNSIGYKVHNNLTSADVDFTAVEGAIKENLDGATITYTFDYLDSTKLLVSMRIVNGQAVDATVTFTVTENLRNQYYVMFHPDGNKFTASTVTTIVPKGAEVSKPVEEHVHKYDETDHCTVCHILNPNHGDTTKGGKAHSYDETLHCTVCGILDPAHTTHNYNKNDNTTCACGALDPNHTHSYVNGLCKYCTMVQDGSTVTEGNALQTTWTSEAGWNSKRYTKSGFAKGSKLVLYGTTRKTEENGAWFSVVAEAVTSNTATSFTMRTDAYGWYFDNNAGSHLIADSAKSNVIMHKDGTTEDVGDWSMVKHIVVGCRWRVEFDWTGDQLVVTMSFTGTAENEGKDVTFTQKYTMDMDTITSFTVQVGTDYGDLAQDGKAGSGSITREVYTPAN